LPRAQGNAPVFTEIHSNLAFEIFQRDYILIGKLQSINHVSITRPINSGFDAGAPVAAPTRRSLNQVSIQIFAFGIVVATAAGAEGKALLTHTFIESERRKGASVMF